MLTFCSAALEKCFNLSCNFLGFASKFDMIVEHKISVLPLICAVQYSVVYRIVDN